MLLLYQQLYYTLQFLDFNWASLLVFHILDCLVMLSRLTIYPNEIYLLKVVEMS